MRHASQLDMFGQTAHSPSFFELTRKLGDGVRDLVDFCIPCQSLLPDVRNVHRTGREPGVGCSSTTRATARRSAGGSHGHCSSTRPRSRWATVRPSSSPGSITCWSVSRLAMPDPHVRPLDRPADGDRQAGRHVPAAGVRPASPSTSPRTPSSSARAAPRVAVHLQPEQPRRRLPAAPVGHAVHGRDWPTWTWSSSTSRSWSSSTPSREPSRGRGRGDPAQRHRARAASARTSACTASGSATWSPTRVARGQGPLDAAEVEPQLASRRPWCSCSTDTCRRVQGEPAPGSAMDRLRHGAASCPRVPGLTRLSRRRATSCFVKLPGRARGHRACATTCSPSTGCSSGSAEQARHDQPVPPPRRPPRPRRGPVAAQACATSRGSVRHTARDTDRSPATTGGRPTLGNASSRRQRCSGATSPEAECAPSRVGLEAAQAQ